MSGWSSLAWVEMMNCAPLATTLSTAGMNFGEVISIGPISSITTIDPAERALSIAATPISSRSCRFTR